MRIPKNVYRCIWLQGCHRKSFAGTASATISMDGYVSKLFAWTGPSHQVRSSCHLPIGIGVFVGTRGYRVLTWYRGLRDITVTAEVVQRQTGAFTKARTRDTLLHVSNHITLHACSTTFTLYFTKPTLHRYFLHNVK